MVQIHGSRSLHHGPRSVCQLRLAAKPVCLKENAFSVAMVPEAPRNERAAADGVGNVDLLGLGNALWADEGKYAIVWLRALTTRWQHTIAVLL